jgi:glycosyltransferase involved in cell wall biosynthesis
VTAAAAPRPRVLIIVQNLPVPFDRRVWLESQALTEHDVDVTVVCPKGPGDPPRQTIDGVDVYKYRQFSAAGGALSFAWEYIYSFSTTAWLISKARRAGRFAVVQACNPPDIFWPLAWLLKRLDGTKSVFDHHDLCPELFASRFPNGPSLLARGLLMLERATFTVADHVISTNDSYADVARRRGRKPAGAVTVVRTGPDDEVLRPGVPVPALRRGRPHLVAYIGVMGPQDGVNLVLEAADHIVRVLGRQDVTFVLMGSGDCHADLVAQRDALGLQDYVELPGRVPDETVTAVLSTAEVGLSPDPLNPLNDVSTMNKTMEYMAFGLPVLAFDLRETRVSAGDAARYVTPGDTAEYARSLLELLDDEPARARMGKFARQRVEQSLSWRHQKLAYLGVYERLLDTTLTAPTTRARSTSRM